MGGRGSKSRSNRGKGNNSSGSGLDIAKMASDFNQKKKRYGNDVGDYTDNNNPLLVSYQAMDDDAYAHYLHQIDGLDVASEYDGWAFYDNPFQKAVLTLNLNAPMTVMDDADFNDYVSQTGQNIFYRGWSSQQASDRMVYAPKSHVGRGIYGDGYYFAESDENTARGYGDYVNAYALSPNARVVKLSTLHNKMAKMSNRARKAMGYAGRNGGNDGESQLALKLGYNVIWCDSGYDTSYYVALTRDSVVMRKSIV